MTCLDWRDRLWSAASLQLGEANAQREPDQQSSLTQPAPEAQGGWDTAADKRSFNHKWILPWRPG